MSILKLSANFVSLFLLESDGRESCMLLYQKADENILTAKCLIRKYVNEYISSGKFVQILNFGLGQLALDFKKLNFYK